MQHIGIIGAMEEEIVILLEKLDKQKTREIAGIHFVTGTIGNMPITVVRSGIGKVNAALAAAFLIQEFDVEIVINTGSAGGIGEGLTVGDVVLSNQLAYHDADARAFGYRMGQIPQMPPVYEADSQLVEKMVRAAEKADLKTVIGEIVSGDSFVSSQEAINKIKEDFPSALVTEMEGAAIAQVCWRFQIPFVVIRAVSDSADEQANVSFDEFIVEAGNKSAEMVLNFIDSLHE